MTSFISVRDEVHDYIRLENKEVEIIGTKIFQRLRNISQNALAHYAYPSLRLSRFEHSLGVCHVTGRMIRSALDAGGTASKNFLKFCGEHGFSNKNTQEQVVRVVRLAALLHDLGHLPFSHAFEKVIPEVLDQDTIDDFSEYQPRSYHEYATLKLIEEDPSGELRPILGQDRELVLKVLRASDAEDPSSPFGVLKELLASDLDGDRADFLLRDGTEVGHEFGRYDLSRVIDNMRIHKDKRISRYLIRPTSAARSVLERFLTERYNIYRWGYYHHHVYFASTVLARIIEQFSIILNNSLWNKAGRKYLRENLKRLQFNNYLYGDNLIPSDDVWFQCFLREVYVKIRSNDYLEDSELRKLHTMIRYLLFRDKVHKSLWKTDLDFAKYNETSFKDQLESKLQGKILRYKDQIGVKQKYLLNFIQDVGHATRLEKLFNSNISTDNYCIIIAPLHELEAYKSGPTLRHSNIGLLHVQQNGEIEPVFISDAAPILESLAKSWKQFPHLYVYMLSMNDESLSKEDFEQLFNEIKSKFAETAAGYFVALNLSDKHVAYVPRLKHHRFVK